VLPLGDRALDILIYLAERPGEVIAKQELFDHVWPDVTVEKGSLRVDGLRNHRTNIRPANLVSASHVAPKRHRRDPPRNSISTGPAVGVRTRNAD